MLTELDIVNSMLAATGIKAVTAGNTDHPAYVKAKTKLDNIISDVLDLGYWFNTSVVTLQPNTDGEIVLPQGTISVDPVDRCNNFVQRGRRLYNADKRTYTFTEDVECTLVETLEIEEMPPTAVTYIKEYARFEFYLDEDGTDPKLSNYRNNKATAWTKLYREHIRRRQTNYFDGPNMANFLDRNLGGYRSRRNG